MRTVAHIPVEWPRARVYEHGWQSWSPAATYRLGDSPLRPESRAARVMNWRPETRPPDGAFWGEGLLAVAPGDGSGIHIVAASPGADPVPSIRADVRGDALLLSADGQVEYSVDDWPGGLQGALGRWASRYAARSGVGPLREAPTLWSSRYPYAWDVVESDVAENLTAIDELDLPVDVIQVDDGYQAQIGDWLEPWPAFGSLRRTVARILDHGRRAGIWVAPFLAVPSSSVARDHPDWLVPDVTAGTNWGEPLGVLDVTRRPVQMYLRTVFETLRDMGIDFFKVDFLYAGAMPGRRSDRAASGLDAYRLGMGVIREAVGPAYLLGCAAPLLPSVGLVDAMRVSPDLGWQFDTTDDETISAFQASATVDGRGRAWQHGRFWVNDPDCLVVGPATGRRQEWAAHVECYGGLRASSDRIRDLDQWGLDTTRRLLRRSSAEPFPEEERPLQTVGPAVAVQGG